MEFLLQLVILALGFAMLVKGADFFVDGSASIAAKFKIPQLIIGLTVVAMGTSAPEAAVSISAAFAKNADITIGNIVGSNILNILIILGVSALITSLAVSKDVLRINLPIVTGASVLLLLLGYDGVISTLDALVIFLCFVAFLIYMIISARRSNQAGDEIKEMSVLKSLIFALGGLVLIVLGSRFTVDSATKIASALGVDDRVIGLTVVALGTSLPELVTSIVAARKNEVDLALGNAIGSNIFNILCILGVTGVISPVKIIPNNLIDIGVVIAFSAIIWLVAWKKRKLNRIDGVWMILLYVAFAAFIVIRDMVQKGLLNIF